MSLVLLLRLRLRLRSKKSEDLIKENIVKSKKSKDSGIVEKKMMKGGKVDGYMKGGKVRGYSSGGCEQFSGKKFSGNY